MNLEFYLKTQLTSAHLDDKWNRLLAFCCDVVRVMRCFEHVYSKLHYVDGGEQ